MSSGAHVRSGLVELLHRLEVPGERRAEYVRSPLVVRDAERFLLAVRPAEMNLEVDGLALAAALPKAPTTRSRVARGWLIVTSPSAHSPHQRAVSSLTAAPTRSEGPVEASTDGPGRRG